MLAVSPAVKKALGLQHGCLQWGKRQVGVLSVCPAICLPGYLAVLLSGRLAVWLSSCLAVRLYGCTAVWLSGCLAVWCCLAEVAAWLSICPAI